MQGPLKLSSRHRQEWYKIDTNQEKIIYSEPLSLSLHMLVDMWSSSTSTHISQQDIQGECEVSFLHQILSAEP